jgi:hypothetical protein
VTWVRIDDALPEHPKVAGLSDAAFRVHVSALCYSARNLTDGFIGDGLQKLYGWQRRARELVEAGLWEPEAGGHRIHDYLDYNPAASTVEEERAAARERMANARSNKRGSSPDVRPNFERSSDNPLPHPLPDVPTEHEEQPKRRHKPVDEEFLAELVAEFSAVFDERRIRDELERAKNHKSWDSWKDKRRGFRDWLKRSAGWETDRRSPPSVRIVPGIDQPERARVPVIPDSLPDGLDASCEPSIVPTNPVVSRPIPAFPRTTLEPRKP